jgi:serine/threonine protein kinase
MSAKIFSVGKASHDAERQALEFLVRGLPDSFEVYTNSWIAERDGSLFELDAVVVAPHAVFVVEIKGYRGAIRGTDHDWLLPDPRPSPLRLNRLTAQVLKSEARRRSAVAGRAWVEGFVFLSHTTDVELSGTASQARVHTRESILAALKDPHYLRTHLTRGQLPEAVDRHTRDVYHELLTGVDPGRAPVRRVREWELHSVLGRGDDYTEYLARHAMTGQKRVLRVYAIPWSATDEQRRRIEQRCTWEAQVLVNVGQHAGIVSADAPFRDEIGVCLPLERFEGISLASWRERYLSEGQDWPSLTERVRLWGKAALALHFAHRQGVVHRLLRPEVILVEDKASRPDLRLTGFELAKQVDRSATVASSALDDVRMAWAAPEIVRDFHEAEPRSDQFSLGALLGLLSTGQDLFASTTELLRRGGLAPHLHDLDPRLPKALDACVGRMLALRPADRFDTVAEAARAVEEALVGARARGSRPVAAARAAAGASPEDLPAGMRLGADYEVIERIGAGGMATVYLARHLMSGQPRALKVARPEPAAEEALRGEYEVLRQLDHATIVRVIDLSALVPERLTMVMERVDGAPLPRWLDAHPDPEPALLRRFAEDLLDALGYLASRDLVHKDIKPDNLLLGPQGLTVIDFSLVGADPSRIEVGTPLYRDPTLTTWDAAADRYAAALCLFELFVGAHAFDGNVPPPDSPVAVDEDEVTPPAMAEFFRVALAPDRAARFGSLDAMRQALRRAMGQAAAEGAAVIDVAALVVDPAQDLSREHLSRGAYNALHRGSVRTQGQLVAAAPEVLGRTRNVGRRRLHEILAYREALIARGVPAQAPEVAGAAPPIAPRWVDDPRPLSSLHLSGNLTRVLREHGFDTVGRLAAAGEDDLLAVPRLGAVRIARIRQALDWVAEHGEEAGPESLDRAWDRATGDLTNRQREVLDLMYGYPGRPPSQTAVAEQMGVTRQAVHLQYHAAIERLDQAPLAPVLDAVRAAADAAGGLLPLADAVAVAVMAMPTEDERLAWLVVRLVLARPETDGPRLVEGLPGQREGVVTAGGWDGDAGDALGAFLNEAMALAAWPPGPAEAVRRSLGALLPGYTGDAVALALRLAEGLRLTPAGELFAPPISLAQAVPFLLQGEHLPLSLAALGRRAREVLGDAVDWPAAEDVARVVGALDLGEIHVEADVEGDMLVATPAGGVSKPVAPEDALPDYLLRPERRPEEVAGDLLRSAAAHSFWRLVVTPPARHRELGRNVARALGPGARFISFEELFLERIEADFEAFERAERFVAMRPKLTRAAEALMEELLQAHGRPGEVVVLGDTAVLQICDALHLVNRLYDATVTGGRGFWAMVVPGIIYEHTPLFNEGHRLAWVEGSVLPVRELIPVAA